MRRGCGFLFWGVGAACRNFLHKDLLKAGWCPNLLSNKWEGILLLSRARARTHKHTRARAPANTHTHACKHTRAQATSLSRALNAQFKCACYSNCSPPAYPALLLLGSLPSTAGAAAYTTARVPFIKAVILRPLVVGRKKLSWPWFGWTVSKGAILYVFLWIFLH